MNNTPQSNRKHVTIFGETNSGKSSLFNAILGTKTAIVSEISGTTTDPVSKSMELLPFGPIVLTDTAGLNDKTNLGQSRVEKTVSLLDRTDFAIYAIDINNFCEEEYETFYKKFVSHKIQHIIVFTKKDISDVGKILDYSKKYENIFMVSVNEQSSINILKEKISTFLKKQDDVEDQLVGSLVPSGGVIIMVVPIDSESPKGRLILPQVQFIRNCLDNGIRCNVTTLKYLKDALNQTQFVDLVVTDSQIFSDVSKIVPDKTLLTSFSILMARQKGDIHKFIEGARYIKSLKDNDKVLISEACTHNRNHEDIGHIKIPAALKKLTGKDLIFEFTTGRDFPKNLEDYAIVIHCGSCMITSKEMKNRIEKVSLENIHITNYGVVLAMSANILDRSVKILENN